MTYSSGWFEAFPIGVNISQIKVLFLARSAKVRRKYSLWHAKSGFGFYLKLAVY